MFMKKHYQASQISDRRLEVEAVFEGVLKPSHFGRNLAFKAAKENRALGRLREGNSTREPRCAGGFSNFRNNPWTELNNFPFCGRRTAHAGVLVVKAILSLGRRIKISQPQLAGGCFLEASRWKVSRHLAHCPSVNLFTINPGDHWNGDQWRPTPTWHRSWN